MSDIRKWFMKSHNKGNASESKPTNEVKPSSARPQPEKPVAGGQDSTGKRKTSKPLATDKNKKDEKEAQELPAKRKNPRDSEDLQKPLPKKNHLDDEDDDSTLLTSKRKSVDTAPIKKLKGESCKGVPLKSPDLEKSNEEDVKDDVSPIKFGGRGRGGRGASAQSSSGRGRGGGRGGFMNLVKEMILLTKEKRKSLKVLLIVWPV